MTHAHHAALPDPGPERATALLIAAFDDERHAHRPELRRLPGDGFRECLGCGRTGPGEPWYECSGGGPRIYEYCADPGCLERVWSYRIPWERFYRLIAPRHAGQLALFEAAS